MRDLNPQLTLTLVKIVSRSNCVVLQHGGAASYRMHTSPCARSRVPFARGGAN